MFYCNSKKIFFAKKSIVLLYSFFFVFSGYAYSENFYVRQGATGNGTSWLNAWGDINNISNIGSGDKVYIAAGNYLGSYTAKSSGWILKRATIEDHGSGTGWNNTYAGTVNISSKSGNTFTLSNQNNITIDGVDRRYFILNGSNKIFYGVLAETTGYNIIIKNATIRNYFAAGVRFLKMIGGIEISNCEIFNNGYKGAEYTDGNIVIYSCKGERGKNTIANNYIHNPGINDTGSNLDSIVTGSTSNLYIYGNTIEPGWEKDNSADLISIRGGTNRYIYNNYFKLNAFNYNQNIFISGSSGDVTNTYIYNNLFYQPKNSVGAPCISMAWFGAENYLSKLNGLYVYNNTMVGQKYNILVGSTCKSTYVDNIVVKNNILNAWWPSAEFYIEGAVQSKMTVNNNFYYQTVGDPVAQVGGTNLNLSAVRSKYGWEKGGGEGEPRFQSLGEGGYRLTSSSPEIVLKLAQIDPGSGLFRFDKDNKDRGSNTWSIGAYEYTENISTSNIVAPTGVRIQQ